MICHTAMVIFIIASSAYEIFVANILTHLAYTMYRCSKLKSGITTKRKQFLFRCYTFYAFVTLVLLFFLVIIYNWSTGNGKYTLLPNGHCAFVDQYSYTTLYLAEIAPIINKLIQITMFIAYIVYFIKFNMMIHAVQTTTRYNQELFKIAIAMGATLGLSYFIFIFLVFDSAFLDAVVGISGAFLLTIQRCIIMTFFLCTKKMSRLWKRFFSRNQVTPSDTN